MATFTSFFADFSEALFQNALCALDLRGVTQCDRISKVSGKVQIAGLERGPGAAVRCTYTETVITSAARAAVGAPAGPHAGAAGELLWS
ncbi:hypothetical protein EVAR_14888_1 [Eumeta japonica]|uniref:Uncharacterized protein n=1 Tax=Eumeta variegata TaxID=151549 RepID=A0A4C1V4K4_EUMVA|nr:hypothetical protein EVAR_14888_1 [Eumeta japonica]